MDKEDLDDIGDLIQFLGSPSPQVKQQAADIVQGLTASPDGIAHLSARADALLPPLLRLVGAAPAPSRAALVALVNLSQETPVQRQLLALNAPARCMDYLQGGSCPHPGLLVMLLANLTAAEEGAEALLQLGKGAAQGLNMAVLLQLFLAPAAPGAAAADAYEHVATVLPNVTRIRAGRRLLLEPGRGTLRALASQLRSQSALRRRGCAGAIKNCCFSCEDDGTAGAIAGEAEALADVLGVLGGAEQVVRGQAEADPEVRLALAEAVACLARSPEGRGKLWDAGAVELLRKGYEFEEDPGVCEAMEAAAALFLEDGFQPEVQADEAEGAAEVAGAEAAWAPAHKMRPPGAPPGQATRIEELE